MDYYIRGHKKRKFTIERSRKTVYTLECPSWMAKKAVAQSTEGQYIIEKNNFWSSNYTIFKNNYIIGKISSNWKGHQRFDLITDSQQLTAYVPSNVEEDTTQLDIEDYDCVRFTMKRKGVFNIRYEIFQNNDYQPIITLYRELEWFKIHHRVEIHKIGDTTFPMEELLGFFGFGAILIRARGGS